ncbi:uncharacterized protein LOC116426521 [Nomia melanderi]|uniref:uncharacterized protein LOC116426521 n=1 Tax=Nomia melanderi TaxID=2448451 RepID=UPI003FCD74ED
METVINNLKMDVSDVPITGMFLVYPQYYIHLLEAPEDIIYKHFKDFYDKQTDDCKVTRSIFLPFHHHVNQIGFTCT